jgi:signal transduction histidine kinase
MRVDRQQVIAKLMRARDEVAEVVDDLVQGDQLRVSWTRILAHNVNNHLTSIFFIIDRFISAVPTEAEEKIYVNGLKEVAVRIQDTIGRLQALTQFDSLVRLAPVQVRSAVVEAVQRQQGYASLKSSSIETKLDVPPGLTIQADRTALIESVLNVIGNAIKYSPTDSVVHVSVAAANGNVEIRVLDHGPGISPEDQQKLFKVGGMASSRPTAGEPQTGIGLAMTSALVTAMNGTIACESRVGAGSTFIIRLPAGSAPSK